MFAQIYLRYLQSSKINVQSGTCERSVDLNLLPILYRMAIYCVLTQTMDELVISNRGKQKFYLIDQVQSMIDRYKQKQRAKIFDEQTLEPMYQALKRMIAVKLENDIDGIRTTLATVTAEMSSNGSCLSLSNFLNGYNVAGLAEHQLIVDFIRNKGELKQLYAKLAQHDDSGKNLLKTLNDTIVDDEANIYDLKVENCIKFRLVLKWEETRHEQAQLILTGEEVNLADSIKEYKLRIDRERIAIAEIENFINFKIRELEEMILKRIQKYNDDVAEYDLNIKMTNEKISQIRTTYEEIQGRYDLRQSEIDTYREEQRILAVKRAFEQEQCRKAIRIQSWWRGVMVRKQLGPYRPKKKGKKGKK